MTERFTPLLTSTDWNAEWKRLQEARERADNPATWDKRSESFSTKHGSHSEYVDRFLELAAVQPGETVLDMGCGTGALAVPLASRGVHVVAADFSPGMLGVLRAQAEERDLSGIEVRVLAWDDDWDAAGLGENCVDVALASRSIATSDLGEALAKLTRVARKRACITLGKSPSPRIDDMLLEACGLRRRVGWDFVYAFNILVAAGIAPEISYIASTRYETFANSDDALATLSDIARNAVLGYATDNEIAQIEPRLRAWLADNLVPSAKDPSQLELRCPRASVWAFLSWSTTD